MKINKEKEKRLRAILIKFNLNPNAVRRSVSESKDVLTVPKHVAAYIKKHIDRPLLESYKDDKVIIARVKSKEYPGVSYVFEKADGYYYATREIVDNDTPSTIYLKDVDNLEDLSVEELASLGDRITSEGRFGL